MKVFAIRDESAQEQKDLAYVFYFERAKQFYIELPSDADEWETPLLLSSFVKRGKTTVDAYWSKVWVQQRIIPPDRQNITQILRDNHMKEYDEYVLLTMAMGRCAQDEYYLVPMREEELSDEIKGRFSMRIEEALPLDGSALLVFFRDGAVKKCNLRHYFDTTHPFQVLLRRPDYFQNVKVLPGGYGLTWDIHMSIMYAELYKIGKSVPLTMDDFKNFAAHKVVNVSEAAKLLDCSRQNILDLTKRGKLHPIHSSQKNTLYLKSDVIKRSWE